jgi:hypothetical protein
MKISCGNGKKCGKPLTALYKKAVHPKEDSRKSRSEGIAMKHKILGNPFVIFLFGILFLFSCQGSLDVETPGITLRLLSPPNGATEQEQTVRLTWEIVFQDSIRKTEPENLSVISYNVYFSALGQPYGIPIFAGEERLEKTDLEAATTYRWKVETTVTHESDAIASEEFIFTTKTDAILPGETLSEPATFSLVNALCGLLRTETIRRVTVPWLIRIGRFHIRFPSVMAERHSFFRPASIWNRCGCAFLMLQYVPHPGIGRLSVCQSTTKKKR